MPLDLIGFGYGFFFLALATVAWALARGRQALLPWTWLAWFGLLRGGKLWLDVLALCLGDSPIFKTVRLALLAISFVALFEFGRRGLKAQGLRMPGAWMVCLLLGLTSLGGVAGADQPDAATVETVALRANLDVQQRDFRQAKAASRQ